MIEDAVEVKVLQASTRDQTCVCVCVDGSATGRKRQASDCKQTRKGRAERTELVQLSADNAEQGESWQNRKVSEMRDEV
jgi:hypothetical protein